ncbi:MAG TPA: nuclear transport factor 2 family protein [Candidatus Limnocylindria bacterium]|jgi:ketosteroid isomerase-like protein|nr:nuclear transport factor 2 family protein [Candidatus Limnocylindria bacterium]
MGAADPWEAVRAINACWTTGRFGDLESLLDKDVVMTGQGMDGPIQGRIAAIDSYSDFMAKARLGSFTERDQRIDVFGDTAVVTYAFDITYQMNERETKESGREAFVLVRREDRWVAVWRTLAVTSSSSENEGASAEAPAP